MEGMPRTCSTMEELSSTVQDLKNFGELILVVLVILSCLSSVDASWESGRLGRLINHSKKKPNCEVTVSTSFH